MNHYFAGYDFHPRIQAVADYVIGPTRPPFLKLPEGTRNALYALHDINVLIQAQKREIERLRRDLRHNTTTP